MVELITPIAAAILCLILIPAVAVLFGYAKDTPSKDDLKAHTEALQKHTESDDACFREIRTKLDDLGKKMDENYRSLVSLYLTGRNGNGIKA